MDLKTIVKDNTARFLRYRQGVAYYGIDVPGHDETYAFPVPVEDVGEGTLLAEEKAMLLMRFIRKALDEGTFRPAAELPDV